MAYQELSDEDKIEHAIKFVAMGQPLPMVLETFLKEAGLYDIIVNPLYGDDNDEQVLRT